MSRKNKAMLEACRGQPCYLQIPGVCLGASGAETVVPCHSNALAHGKGMGLKAKDRYTVPGCYACHAELDQGRVHTKEEKRDFWRSAYERWEPVRENVLAKKDPATVSAVPGPHSHTI